MPARLLTGAGQTGYNYKKAIFTKEAFIMGMTDLQFKSHLRMLISLLDEATKKDTKEEILAEINKLKKNLQEDLQG